MYIITRLYYAMFLRLGKFVLQVLHTLYVGVMFYKNKIQQQQCFIPETPKHILIHVHEM